MASRSGSSPPRRRTDREIHLAEAFRPLFRPARYKAFYGGRGSGKSYAMATALVPNAETWLDFTDLVFLDPVGTGYSRAAGTGEDGARRYYEVDADAATLAAAIARWLRANDRLALVFAVTASTSIISPSNSAIACRKRVQTQAAAVRWQRRMSGSWRPTPGSRMSWTS